MQRAYNTKTAVSASLMDWFRMHHGAALDTKWLAIARRAKTSPAEAAAVWWALLDHASQASPRGSVAGFDAEAVEIFFGMGDGQVRVVIDVLTDRKMISEETIAKWPKRQPEKTDLTNSDRQARFKKRRKQADASTDSNGGNAVTGNDNSVANALTPIREDKRREDKIRGESKKEEAGEIKYCWQGEHLKLVKKDYDEWDKRFRRIRDLDAELNKCDAWYLGKTKPSDGYYPAFSRWLSKSNADLPDHYHFFGRIDYGVMDGYKG
jgi:hypothetical protein